MERIQKVDTNYIACRKASPCCELPWDAISDSIPDKSLWDDSKKRKAEAAERRGNLQDERARKARERRERQMRAQAEVAAQRSAGRGNEQREKTLGVPCIFRSCIDHSALSQVLVFGRN